MSVSSVIRGGLGSTPSDMVRLGLGSGAAPTTDASAIITLGLLYTPSRVILLGMEGAAGGGTWDFAAATNLSLAATLAISGDIEFLAPFDVDSYTLPLAATLGVSGDIQFVVPFDFDGCTLPMAATLAVSGDFEFSDVPLVPRTDPVTGRSWLAMVLRAGGKDYTSPEPAYEFTKRTFNDGRGPYG